MSRWDRYERGVVIAKLFCVRCSLLLSDHRLYCLTALSVLFHSNAQINQSSDAVSRTDLIPKVFVPFLTDPVLKCCASQSVVS
ncbi:unnamed protein product [Thelazia callipaeda]|uniref:Secreted protein n=1 Tax=Thelazia callipaeda TaxID=103827 RepID=A0A0N5D757_THECL|nr:unnamed protein product [Thelazia callipaeda]